MEMFGERVRRLRLAKGIPLKTVADRLGISDVAVVHFEACAQLPRACRLEPLARLLNVSIDYLLTGRRDPATAALHRAIRAGASQSTLLAMLPAERGDHG